MRQAKMQLANSFHNTETTIQLTPAEMDRIEVLSWTGDQWAIRRMRDVKRRLCGVSGCKCSDGWGRR